MGGKNKDRKARDWHTISRRGPRSVSRRRGGAFRLLHDLLISAALLPISGSPERGRKRASAAELSKDTHFPIINNSCSSISTTSAQS